MVPILLSSLVFLFPLGTYCLILARINQRRHPLLVSGVQDCAGLLLALSGFLFFICPSILTGFNYRPLDVWLYYHYASLPRLGHRGWIAWMVFLWALYLVLVFGGSGFLLWLRRRRTVIYNVEPEVFDQVLGSILTRLDLAWTRSAQCIYVDFSSLPAAQPGHETFPAPHPSSVTAHSLVSTGSAQDEIGRSLSGYDQGQPPVPSHAGEILLEVDSWLPMRHVTLNWALDTGPWREMIERELARVLAQVRTRKNPVGMWLMTAAAGLFVLTFLLTVLFELIRLNQGAW